MSVGLALGDVGDVHFYDGSGNEFDGICEGDGGVGICGGVEYDAVCGEADGLELVDESAFAIGLEVGEVELGEFRAQGLQVVFEGESSVEGGGSSVEEVEVGAVNDPEGVFFHC